jgi:hypothetical protein
MKKKAVKKLRLSRETLRNLKSSDAQKVWGGNAQSPYSPETGRGDACCTRDPSLQMVC